MNPEGPAQVTFYKVPFEDVPELVRTRKVPVSRPTPPLHLLQRVSIAPFAVPSHPLAFSPLALLA